MLSCSQGKQTKPLVFRESSKNLHYICVNSAGPSSGSLPLQVYCGEGIPLLLPWTLFCRNVSSANNHLQKTAGVWWHCKTTQLQNKSVAMKKHIFCYLLCCDCIMSSWNSYSSATFMLKIHSWICFSSGSLTFVDLLTLRNRQETTNYRDNRKAGKKIVVLNYKHLWLGFLSAGWWNCYYSIWKPNVFTPHFSYVDCSIGFHYNYKEKALHLQSRMELEK